MAANPGLETRSSEHVESADLDQVLMKFPHLIALT
jgi:hypothetical protein